MVLHSRTGPTFRRADSSCCAASCCACLRACLSAWLMSLGAAANRSSYNLQQTYSCKTHFRDSPTAGHAGESGQEEVEMIPLQAEANKPTTSKSSATSLRRL